MERASFADMNCSIARTLEIIGEWWTLLILRDAFLGLSRWADRWTAGEAGPPLLLVHEPCGRPGEAILACARCGEEITLGNVRPEPGPGAH